MKKLNILFLGGAKRVSLAERFVVAGKKLDLNIRVFSYEINKHVPFKIVGKIILGMKWNDKKIYNDLLKVIIKKNISIVIANVDLATIVLANLNKKFPHLKLITSDKYTCNIFHDKLKTYNECKKLKIKTIPFSKNTFPMFVKPKKGSASKYNYKIINKDHYKYCFKKINEKKFIKQEFIKGLEYTVDAYVSKERKFIGAVPRIRYNVSDGESTTSIVVKDLQIIELTKNILKKFNLLGPITLQFIKKNKQLYFLEINPRFGGGVIASIEAGFDIPKIMIMDYLDIPYKNLSNYKELIMTRSYREVFHALDN